MELQLAVFGESIGSIHDIAPSKIVGDVAICTGNFTAMSYKYEYEEFLSWLKKVDCQYKIVCPGYREQSLASREPHGLYFIKQILEEDKIFFLENESVKLDGFKFYGCPQHPFLDECIDLRAYEVLDDGLLKTLYDRIPNDTDVLITGCAPYSICDSHYSKFYERNMYNGSDDLAYRILDLKPLAHCFSAPKVKPVIIERNGIQYVNGTIRPDMCGTLHTPQFITIKK